MLVWFECGESFFFRLSFIFPLTSSLLNFDLSSSNVFFFPEGGPLDETTWFLLEIVRPSSVRLTSNDREPREFSIILICSLEEVFELSLTLADKDEDDSADEDDADDCEEAVDEADDVSSLATDLSE